LRLEGEELLASYGDRPDLGRGALGWLTMTQAAEAGACPPATDRLGLRSV
jgi:hypothetical protein